MKTITTVLLAVVGAALPAQSFLHLPNTLSPASSELGSYNLRPFMQLNSRVQMFYSAAEVGSSSFTATQLEMRWDGPVPQVGAPGPFAIQRLRIQIGTSTVMLPGAEFTRNVTTPLTTVFDGPWSYLPDPGSAAPHPWGAPGNSLTFPFLAPASIAIPPGGWLVIELIVEGNGQTSFSHALLDGSRESSAGPQNGTAVDFGMGCSAAPGLPIATMTTTGVHAPAAAHFIEAQNLGVNRLVALTIGLNSTFSPSFGPLPWTLPGSSCTLQHSVDGWLLTRSDLNGAIPPGSQAAAIAVPADPILNGLRGWEQVVSFVPTANPLGLVLTNARQIDLGAHVAPVVNAYAVSHGSLADAVVADKVEAFAYAIRLQTQ